MEKQHYIDQLNFDQPNSKLGIYQTFTVILNFNDVLQNDLDGRYFVYDAKYIHTPKAELLTEGETWGTPAVAFQLIVPKWGRKLCFKAIGIETAQYTQLQTTIFPCDTSVWLIADREFRYSA